MGVFCPTLNICGGAEFVAVTISNALALNHYEVVLFSNEKPNQKRIDFFWRKRLNSSVKVVVKPSWVRPKYLLDFYQTIFRSYLFKLKCDVWIDVYSCRIFPWTNVSYIHFPFSNHYDYNFRFPYLKSRRIIQVSALPYVIFEKNVVSNKGKLILANSRYTAKEIRRFLGKKAKVLYPPVSSASFDDIEKLSMNQRRNLVVTISRFAPTKSLEKIPYIASLTSSDIQFAIIGQIHDKSTLLLLQKLTKEQRLTDRIKFFPEVSKRKMKEVLKCAKVYLHTMVGEHFGISIVEAMAMGCTPIVHDSGGPREFVPEEFRYKTIREAAEKITKEIHEWSPEKAIEMKKIAKKFKEDNFSEQFIELFNSYVVREY